MTDSQSSTTLTTGTVEVGGSATGEIGHAGDTDWFAVTLEAGKTYRIDLKGSSSRAGTLRDPYLTGIHDADGNAVAGMTDNDSGRGRDSQLTFTVETTGTYYVSAGAQGSNTGTYQVSVTDVTGTTLDDHGASTGTAGTLAVGGSVTGNLGHAGDEDWFAVTLESGKTYRIDLQGASSGAGTLRDPYLGGLHDADGNWVAGTSNDDGGSGKDSQVTFTVRENEGGTYYVAASGYWANSTGTYKVSVTDITDDSHDDYGASTATTGTVTVGGSATGEIGHVGDVDWFAVTLEAGKTYRIDLKGASSATGTLRDPYLAGLYDVDGNAVAGMTDGDSGYGRDSQVTFTAGAAGTYYVAAGAQSSSNGTYTVSVTDITGTTLDDHGASAGTAGTVVVGGSVTGNLGHGGDEDWFAVALEAGKTYRIDLQGASSGAGTLSDPYLRGLYDADGDWVAGTSNDDGGTGKDSQVTFTVETAGTYYVAATGYWANSTGTYKVSVADVTVGSVDDYGTSTGTAGTVAVGGSATGEVGHERDVDWFAVALEAGKTYRIDLKGMSSGSGTLRDPYLAGLHDADGNAVAGMTDDDSGDGRDSQLTFAAQTTGTYYVAAGARGITTGTYTVSVADVTGTTLDDYGASTGTAGAVAVDGSVTGELGHSGDVDWFAVTLEAGKTYRIDLLLGLT